MLLADFQHLPAQQGVEDVHITAHRENVDGLLDIVLGEEGGAENQMG